MLGHATHSDINDYNIGDAYTVAEITVCYRLGHVTYLNVDDSYGTSINLQR